MNKQPTNAELVILSILWKRETATVREVHDIVSESKPTVYTTTLKTMQIMCEKGLVERETSKKAHAYKAGKETWNIRKELVGNILETVFQGSAIEFVQHILIAKPLETAEMKEIRKMIKLLEKSKKSKK
jgi:BlaI family transcriptional regulator, penicillinase repressor